MPFPSDFPSTEELNRVAKEHEYFKLYTSESLDPDGNTDRGKWRLKEFFEGDKKKAQILDIALNLAPLIIDSATDFIVGEPVKIQVDGGDETKQALVDKIVRRNALQQKIEQSAALFQAIGHDHFKLYKQADKAVIENVPYDYWFPSWEGVTLGQETKNPRLVVYMNHTDGAGVVTKYIYIEDYYLEGTTYKIAKSVWEDQSGKIGKQVSLDTIGMNAGAGAVAKGLTIVEDTGITELPIVTVNQRKTAKQRHGESVLKKVRPLLQEINDRLTQLSIQFLKHLNAKLQVPEGTVTRDLKTGAVKSVNLEVLIAKQGDPEAKYITNDNPLIEQSFVHLEKLIRKVAKLTQTPDSFLTEDDKGGVEKAEALKTRLMSFLKKIKNYQTKYEEAVRQLIRLALLIEGQQPDQYPLVITFDPGLPKDWETDIAVWGDAKAQGLASRETAVARFQGIEGEELDEELKRIDAEEEKAMQSAIDMATAQQGDEENPQE